MNSKLIRILFILLMTTTIVISDNNKNKVLNLEDSVPLKQNITCLCTSDELCDEGSATCQLTHSNHRCYESWTLKKENDPNYPIQVTAGYVNISKKTSIFINVKFNQ